MITWLIGKNEDIDIFWNEHNYEILKDLEHLKIINLFEEKYYKYTFNKKDTKFFEQCHENFQNNLLIKGNIKIDEKIMNKSKDKIINFDSLSKNEIFKLYLNLKKTNISENIKKYTKNLLELNIIIKLKELEIPETLWPIFLNKSKDNWYLKLKNNSLFKECIINNDNIITMIQYSINSNHKFKPILLFLQSKIKEGFQIWDLDKIWLSLLEFI